MRRKNYQAAATLVASASKEIGKYWDSLDVYVPDVDEICEVWEESIRSTFTIQPLHGDDAIEGLMREAHRRRPAKDGKGSRDAAIWLTVLRMASEGSTVVFVSNNTRDFGDGRSGDLHPDLAVEATASAGSIVYLHMLDNLVAYLAKKIDPPSFLNAEIQERFRHPVAIEALTILDDLSLSMENLEQIHSDGAEITLWTVIGSYELEMMGLALVDGEAVLHTGDSSELTFTFRGWVDFDISKSEIISVSVEEARLKET